MRPDRLTLFVACAAALLFVIGCGDAPEPRVESVDADPRPAGDYDAEPTAEDGAAEYANGNGNNDEEAEAEPEPEMHPWEGDGIAWQTPEPWVTEEAEGLRYATILHGEREDSIEIAVTRFPGDVGGVSANVNRWSQQVGAPPASSEEDLAELLTEVEVDGENALIAEIEGTEDRKLVALILPDHAHDRTWFFRLSGTTEAVNDTMPTFERIVDTIELDRDEADNNDD